MRDLVGPLQCGRLFCLQLTAGTVLQFKGRTPLTSTALDLGNEQWKSLTVPWRTTARRGEGEGELEVHNKHENYDQHKVSCGPQPLYIRGKNVFYLEKISVAGVAFLTRACTARTAISCIEDKRAISVQT